MNTLDQIKKQARLLSPELIKIRRKIHAFPELGYQEFNTSALIAKKLDKLGLTVKENVAQTGVVALLKGDLKGKTVAVRADIDALPITEKTKKAYKSKRPGLMHACGHDAKIAILIGVAALLKKIKNKIKGNIKFVFEPNEEGTGGAQAMIKEGILTNPKVDAMFCFDFDFSLKTGHMGIRHNITTANVDDFELILTGPGGHSARLYKTVDLLLVSAKIIEALHYYIPRKQNPFEPVALTLGQIHGGNTNNVIPDRVQLSGTIRTFDAGVRRRVLNQTKKIIADICRTYNADFNFEYTVSYPAIINNKRLNSIITDIGSRLLGPKNIYTYRYPFFEGEDVSFFFNKVPGSIFSLGIRNVKKGTVHPLHSPYFDIDESALTVGVEILSGCVLKYLDSLNA